MTTDNSAAPQLPRNPGEEWRRTFIVAIYQLAAGEVDHLQVDDWAIQAQAQHGHHNPVEVAHDEWISGGRYGRS